MILWNKPVSLKHPALCVVSGIFLVTIVWTLVTKVVFLKYMDPFASHPLQPLAFRLNFCPTSWLMARFIFTWGRCTDVFFAVRSFYIVYPDCISKKDTQRNWMPQPKATTSKNSANLSPHTPANLSTATGLIAFFHHPPICDLSCGMGGWLRSV